MKAYRIVNDQVIDLLKNDIIPWKIPLRYQRPHQNYFTKNVYKGINALILNGIAHFKNYNSSYWITFDHVKLLNGSIKQHEKSTKVIFYKKNQNKKGDTYTTLRFINVFNLDQIVGIPKDPQEEIFNPYLKTTHIIENFIGSPKIIEGEENFYCPQDDFIEVQDKTNFIELSKLLIKSTGHIDRLNRVSSNFDINHPLFILEDLVIEVGSFLLCGLIRLNPEALTNKKEYIRKYKIILEENPNILINASSMASRAVKFILFGESH